MQLKYTQLDAHKLCEVDYRHTTLEYLIVQNMRISLKVKLFQIKVGFHDITNIILGLGTLVLAQHVHPLYFKSKMPWPQTAATHYHA